MKEVFLKAREGLCHRKQTSNSNLMKVETDFLEYAKKLSNFTLKVIISES